MQLPGQRCQSSRLDLRQFRRRGWLTPGTSGPYSWNRDGEPCGSVSFAVLDGVLELHYKILDDADQWQQVSETIPIQRVPCRFGGERRYWICPNCRRTCEIVVITSTGTSGAVVAPCASAITPRGWRPRIGYSTAPTNSMLELSRMTPGTVHKHKWMRSRTFNRLMERADAAAPSGEAWFLYRLQRLGFLDLDDAAASILGEGGEAGGAPNASLAR